MGRGVEGGLSDSAQVGAADGAGAEGGVALQSGESGDPIVDWTTSGTARWMIDANGCLTIAPLEGEESGELENWSGPYDDVPWDGNRSWIISAKIEGAIAIPTAAGMFSGCSLLRSLDLSGLDTSKVTDMSSMFYNCSSLESLDLSSFDTSKVTDMSNMFYNCSSLESLDLSSFDTSKVTGMSWMFSGCSLLKSLDLSGLDTSSATGMYSMFSDCSSLESLDLSSFDTSRLTGMSKMFYNCSSLSSLDLSSFVASKVTDMSKMFCNCSSLSSLDLSSFGTSRAKDMSYMFSGCSSLSSLDLSGFGTLWAEDMCQMFADCSKLKSLDLSGLDTSRAKDMHWMFYGCSALRKVTLGEKFSFKAPEAAFLRGYLPAPEGESLTGKWLSWADGKAYAPVDIPSNVAATYSAERSFPDVDYDNDWFAPAVTFASSRGLITGYSDTGKFGPLDTLTRGQLATILWRNACPDAAASYDASKAVNETGLDGIADHEYYTEAANWAFAKGVITGFERPDGTFDFAAGDPVSFEQMVTIVSRLGAKPGEVAAAGDDLSRFADGDAASPWSRGPIAWAAEKGLVGGYENADGTRTLAPGEDVQRGRAATILMRAFDLGIMK